MLATPLKAKRTDPVGLERYRLDRPTRHLEAEVLEVQALADEDRRQAYRSERWTLLRTLRSASGLRSVRSCMRPIGSGSVTLSAGRNGVAHVAGVGRCGSPWACPVCSPVVRRHRAAELDEGLARHLEAGGSGAFLTVTLPHKREDSLESLLEVLVGGWRSLQQSRGWRSRAKALGLVGMVKALEVTTGQSGWHPHLHLVLLFEDQVDGDDLEGLRTWLTAAWGSKIATQLEGRRLHQRHGVDLRPLTSSEQMGDYLVKVDGGWGAAMELLRGDLKHASRGGMSMPHLLRLAGNGDVADGWAWHKWWEYESATKGRRMLTWSRGLRARLGLGQELTDEEAAASLERPTGDHLEYEVPDRRWALLLERGQAAGLLARFEVAVLLAYGLCGAAPGAPPG